VTDEFAAERKFLGSFWSLELRELCVPGRGKSCARYLDQPGPMENSQAALSQASQRRRAGAIQRAWRKRSLLPRLVHALGEHHVQSVPSNPKNVQSGAASEEFCPRSEQTGSATACAPHCGDRRQGLCIRGWITTQQLSAPTLRLSQRHVLLRPI
jgi:hypothetical protein